MNKMTKFLKNKCNINKFQVSKYFHSFVIGNSNLQIDINHFHTQDGDYDFDVINTKILEFDEPKNVS